MRDVVSDKPREVPEGSHEYHPVGKRNSDSATTSSVTISPNRWRRFAAYVRRLLRRRPEIIVSPALAVAAIAAWDVTVRGLDVSPIIFPPPGRVVGQLWAMLQSPRFFGHLGTTLTEFAVGFVFGVVTAGLVGAVLARSRTLEKGLYPYIVAFQTFPKIAIAPILITWFGFGMASKMVLAFVLAFFPVFVNVLVGLKAATRDQIDLLRSLSASEWQVFRLLRLKIALPYAFAGARIAAVFSLLGAITGEFIGASRGLGYLIVQQSARLAVDAVFASLVVMAAIGLSMHTAIGFLHRRIVFWEDEDDDRRKREEG